MKFIPSKTLFPLAQFVLIICLPWLAFAGCAPPEPSGCEGLNTVQCVIVTTFNALAGPTGKMIATLIALLAAVWGVYDRKKWWKALLTGSAALISMVIAFGFIFFALWEIYRAYGASSPLGILILPPLTFIGLCYFWRKKLIWWKSLLIPVLICFAYGFATMPQMCLKPVIYLYPPHEMKVAVRMDYDGDLTVTYPQYHDGWRVTAYPDGTLINEDGKEYSYLFWEGKAHKNTLRFDDGFVVKGSDSADFLREKLALMGLTPREYNEFIVYWLPQLLKNPYNLIHFAGEDYRKQAQLTVSPAPDSEIRVFMMFRALSGPVSFPRQTLTPVKRHGFAVVEWGGTQVP